MQRVISVEKAEVADGRERTETLEPRAIARTEITRGNQRALHEDRARFACRHGSAGLIENRDHDTWKGMADGGR